MAWLVVDEDKTELLFIVKNINSKTDRRSNNFTGGFWCRADRSYRTLPNGFIAQILGRKLTWDNDPVELVERIK